MTRRRGILLALVGIVLLLFGGFLVANLFRRSLATVQAPTPPPPQTSTVVVITHDVPLGTVLNPVDLAQVEVPVNLVPSGAISQVEAVVGRLTKVALVGGEMIMRHNLVDPTNRVGDLAFEIGDDKVLMAFPITDLMSQLELLQYGDQVDILVSIEEEVQPVASGPLAAEGTPEPQTMLFTFDALQRVVISAVVVELVEQQQQQPALPQVPVAEGTPQPTPVPPASATEPRALMLALSPQDALVLKNLKDDGAIFDLVLRSPTSTQLFELDPVSSEYLIDRFELEVTK